jgi:tetratricopeptide (TPR) repeat protein
MILSRLFTVLFALLAAVAPEPNPLALLQAGKANEALQLLNAQVQGNPQDARAYNLLARVYFQMQRWEDAIHAAEKSVALSGQDSEYHQWLARSQGRKAEVAGPISALFLVRKVKAEFEKAVALDPEGKNLSARADLSEFYIEAPSFMGGDKTKARRLADFVRSRDAALADFIVARVEERQNIKDQAERDYKAAIQDSNSQANYWVALANFYRRAGRLDDMEVAVAKSLSAPHKDAVFLLDAALTLQAANRNLPQAIQMLRRYLAANDPGEDGPAFQAHYVLGSLLEKQGDRKGASAEYRAALVLAGQYKPAQDALAKMNR